MADEWTIRERLLAAINGDEPDRVPVTVRNVHPLKDLWSNGVERMQVLTGLGIDETIGLGVPTALHPDVRVRVWREEADPRPILHKEFETPAGTLHMSVQLTDDWMVDDVPLVSDHAWSRGVEPPVKSRDDLPALDYVLPDPRGLVRQEVHERMAEAKTLAERSRTLVVGRMNSGPSAVMNFLGPQKMMLMVYDDPELVEATMEKAYRWNGQCLDLMLECGVDVVYRSCCYETVDFWSPEIVRRWFLPNLAEQVNRCHEAGAKCHGFVQTGGMPFLEDYATMGLDILSSLDDAGANPMDLAECKRVLGGRVCLWGGVDPRAAFERGTPDDVRREVLRVLRVLAPGGGYVLGTTGSFQQLAKPENVRAYPAAGVELGRYPLDFPD